MPALSKLSIGSLDDIKVTVEAQFNPAAIDLSKHANWQDHPSIQGRKKAHHDILDLEYAGNPGRVMKLELVFDQYEQGKSIEPDIAMLQRMASPRDEWATKEDERRPHLCVVAWNNRGIPRFECVVESVDVKYSMFSPRGLPLRATCTVSLREARIRDGFRRAR
jgi:hypothetical protein